MKKDIHKGGGNLGFGDKNLGFKELKKSSDLVAQDPNLACDVKYNGRR